MAALEHTFNNMLKKSEQKGITCSKSSTQALMHFLCLVICLMNSSLSPLQAHYAEVCTVFLIYLLNGMLEVICVFLL